MQDSTKASKERGGLIYVFMVLVTAILEMLFILRYKSMRCVPRYLRHSPLWGGFFDRGSSGRIGCASASNSRQNINHGFFTA
jgi:hypothetical protein